MKTASLHILFLFAIGWFGFGSAQGGDLEPPPGPVAPTMVTLQQIFDQSAGGAGVAATGQTLCYDAAGTVIACAGTGQDGEYQLGATVAPRFTDNGDGTVKDNLTGLIWLADANCFGQGNWTTALSNATSLASGACGLSDGSQIGDWRLPNVRELRSLVDYGITFPALPAGHPFSGVQSSGYWSSTTNVTSPDFAWGVILFNGGFVSSNSKTNNNYAWPVRN